MKVTIDQMKHMLEQIGTRPTDRHQHLNIIVPVRFDPQPPQIDGEQQTTKSQSFITLTSERQGSGDKSWYEWVIDVN